MMDEEAREMIAALKGEITQLRAEMASQAENRAGGDGADVGLPITPIGSEQGAFRFEGTKITQCRFMFGRQVYSLDDVSVAEGEADGTWSLLIPHATPAQASVVRNTNEATGLTQTVVPLFTVTNGEVAADWRGMPVVPVRE